MSGTLLLHRGAREVPRGYLATVPTPVVRIPTITPAIRH